ncbi:leucine-rich repeat-containing protein 15-like isoform X2 [Branchiostoma floridae]|uniref:Leucine-rich repeat-containing protein 15-like isoform X2 n=1 Tax=Branchiostoma floridae TaxID=7739 RepID=A0A9J7MQJ0_BRAFL|nr:leucine-rich repeat-containing protein 15-like isoform X2 [Branchiostoma floridae]
MAVICHGPSFLHGLSVTDVNPDSFLATCPTGSSPKLPEEDVILSYREAKWLECPEGCHCPQPTEVVCRNTGLTSVPDRIPWNTRTLDLSGNLIYVAHESEFSSLKNLRSLVLSNNRLMSFPLEALESMQSLWRLHIENNDIDELPFDAFVSLRQLRSLTLDVASSETLSGCLEPLIRLRNLVIYGQQLPIVPPRAFYGLFRLQSLELRLGCSTAIDGRAFDDLQNVRYLDISGSCVRDILGVVRIMVTAIHLETLKLSNNSIVHLPSMAFVPMLNLKVLNMSHNFIQTIHPLAFHGLMRLISLNLDNNNLSKVPLEAFESLPRLRHLSLRGNNIINVPGEAFTTLTSIREIFLDANMIESISINAFHGLEELQNVSVAENPLECDCNMRKFMEALDNLSWDYSIEVENMRCSGPPVFAGWNVYHLVADDFVCGRDKQAEIAATFQQMVQEDEFFPCPESFTCDGLVATSVGRGLTVVPLSLPLNTTALVLSNNSITDIPAGAMKELARLQYLQLDHNKIRTITSRSLKTVPLLKVLDLSNNMLDQIDPGAFSGIPKLTSLLLSNNKLKTVPVSALKSLPNLRELRIGNNNVKSLDLPLPDHSKLRLLDLSGNCLESIRVTALTGLPMLRALNLSNTCLDNVPTTQLSLLHNLRALDLSRNNITFIAGRALAGLKQLRELILTGNSITRVQNLAFKGLTHLYRVSFASNRLRRIPKALRKLTTLSEISLPGNKITDISARDLPSLRGPAVIDIRDNRLEQLDPDVFSSTQHVRLDLAGNPWRCDCDLLPLRNWMEDHEDYEASINPQPTCASPVLLEGHPMMDVPTEDFRCPNRETVDQSD